MLKTFIERPVLSTVISIIIVILGVLGLVFWFGIFTSAFRYHKFFINTLHLKAKNNSLVEQMKVERSETEKVNQLLIASNQKLDASNINLEAEVERRTAELYRLSNRDPLTDLLNRNGFLKHLNKLIDTTRALENSLAVLFIDLDGFKQVNDSLGHKIGDIVLAEIAKRLRNYTEDNHLGRWGGDEADGQGGRATPLGRAPDAGRAGVHAGLAEADPGRQGVRRRAPARYVRSQGAVADA